MSLAMQGKSGPESKLSYPANPSSDMCAVNLGLRNSSPAPIFTGEIASCTEVQRVSFVGSTNEDCHPHPLCNLQNLHAVPS